MKPIFVFDAGGKIRVRSFGLSVCALLALTSSEVLAQKAEPPENPGVIGIQYRCETAPTVGAGDSAVCSTTVSKDEFDALVQALDPNMPAGSRQSLAAEYSRLLIMATEAHRRGIDKLPELQTLLKFSALQVMASQLVRYINAQTPSVSPEEVEEYFRDHANDYQEITLSRIFVPENHTGHGKLGAAERAEDLRTRALNGENFSALQHEVLGGQAEMAGQTLRLGPMPCLSLPEAHRAVCNLQPGEVSPAFSDNLGYSIYRLESRRGLDLNDARDVIRPMLERQRVQKEIEAVRTPVALDLNENYFGELPKADVASKHGMHFPAASSPGGSHGEHHH